jgi:Zn-finger nucleic acid-binding protein
MNRFFSGKNKYETEKNKGEDDILCQYVREEEYMKRKKRFFFVTKKEKRVFVCFIER